MYTYMHMYVYACVHSPMYMKHKHMDFFIHSDMDLNPILSAYFENMQMYEV